MIWRIVGLVFGRALLWGCVGVGFASVFAGAYAQVVAPATEPGAPVVGRAVAADWGSESFTIYWRPPVDDGGGEITGYKIFREQHDVGYYRNSHPHDCDGASFGRSLEQFAFTVAVKSEFYAHTVKPSAAPGATHGNCYRWKIAAVNSAGVGPTVTTDPILARGYTTGEGEGKRAHGHDDSINGNLCPAGHFRYWDGDISNNGDGWSDDCKPRGHAEGFGFCAEEMAARARRGLVGDLNIFINNFGVPFCTYSGNVSPSDVDCGAHPALVLRWCNISQGSACGEFSEHNLDHRECLCSGWAEPAADADRDSPASCVCNVPGADENCECPAGSPYSAADHWCGCPAGRTYDASEGGCVCDAGTLELDGVCVRATAENKCKRAKWETVGVPATACKIPHYNVVDDESYEACSFTIGGAFEVGEGERIPGCEEAFGEELVFPTRPPLKEFDELDYYFHNCDPAGDRGLIPGGANTVTVGATNCSCVDSGKLRTGVEVFVNTDGADEDGEREYTNGACIEHDAESAAMDCLDGFWDLSGEGGGKCVIPISQGGTLSLSGCFLTGEAEPQCDEIFDVMETATVTSIVFPFDFLVGEERFVFNCPGGMAPARNTGDQVECLADAEAQKEFGRQACEGAGWSADSQGDGKCVVPTAAGGVPPSDAECFFTGSGVPQCAEIFGPDLSFPARGAGGVTLVYNCDPDGSLGKVPARFATGASLCECAPGRAEGGDGVCRCPAGESLSPVGEVCVADSIADAVGKCENAGWEIASVMEGNNESFGCRIRSVNITVLSGAGQAEELCEFSDLTGARDCAEVFGADLNFPTAGSGESPYHIYNCDAEGVSGLLPATRATIAAESCGCGSGMAYVGGRISIFATGGTTPFGGGCFAAEVADAAEKCAAAGWEVSAEDGGRCAIPVERAPGTAEATVSAGCYFGGAMRPHCATVFGAGFDFPMTTASGVTLAYNCDPDGLTGLVPATFADGRTACECAGAGQALAGGVCACPAGETAAPVSGTCTADSIAGGVGRCEMAGWGVAEHQDLIDGHSGAGGEYFACAINFADVSRNAGGEACEFADISDLPECADAFGAGFDFPTAPEGSRPAYLYNCDPEGSSGLAPATFASGEAESCRCAEGLIYAGRTTVIAALGWETPFGGFCVSGEAEGVEQCAAAGWGVSLDEGGRCLIPIAKGAPGSAGATVYAGCFFDGEEAPQCAEVFGSGFAFPMTTGTAVTFAFDCGERMVPARENLNGATSCECAAVGDGGECVCGRGKVDDDAGGCKCPEGTHYDLGDVCVPDAETDEDFDGFSQEELCRGFGGRVLEEGDGKVCAGLDLEGTFCVLDAGEEGAFPCRGMFKHLRRCNGVWNRPGVNVFLCGGVCEEGRARGRHCL